MKTDRRNASQTRPTLTTISEAKSLSVNRLMKDCATAKGVGKNSGLIMPDVAVRCQDVKNRINPNIPSMIFVLWGSV
jgi:N-acetylglutamate synthase/N-acetylornithine aminotransferase